MNRPPSTVEAVLPTTHGRDARPLHGATASRAMEQLAQADLPPHTLMARAGLSVARLTLAAWPGARRVHAFAGPGNNGGDALIAATRLKGLGLDVAVTLLADPQRLPDDAAWARQQAQDSGVAINTALPGQVEADVLLDGLLGLGVTRAPTGALAQAIRCMSLTPAKVLAIDLPSGLDADHGSVLGTATQAAHTLSLLSLKPGLFTAQGRDHAGRVWLDRLGVAPTETPLWLNDGDRMQRLRAGHAFHKGSFGDVLIVGGAVGMAGAAMLAARAGLAAGAGRVFLALLDPSGPTADLLRPELMVRPPTELLKSERLRTATVVCGCGGGDQVAALLPAVLAHAKQLVLDADALNAVAADPTLRQRLTARHRHDRQTVLTPHPLEAARLLDCSAAQVQANRFDAARSLAAELGCTVVLKGSGSLIARADGRVAVNPTGNPRLATAGTGDVLAGWIGGLWARQTGDGCAAAESAVFRHGLAADLYPGDGPLRAADLIERMAA
jgi:hydroxyethylthiazole kinase-like uncharacterized protein yjeF